MRPKIYSDDRIFKSISTVLAKQGYEALTLQKIAEQAGLSPAILSKRFGSKRGMLFAYYGHLIAVTRKSFDDLSKQSLPVTEALTEAFTQWHGFIKKPRELANFMMLYLDLDIEPEFIGLSKERFLVIDAGVQAILREGIRRGEIRCPEVAGMSQVLQAAATGASLIWIRDGEGVSPKERIESCIRTILGDPAGGMNDRSG